MLRVGQRTSREMLSTRISTALYDRLKLYVAAKKINLQDFVEETLQEKLDEVDPLGKVAKEKKAALAESSVAGDDRLQKLESQIAEMRELLIGTRRRPR